MLIYLLLCGVLPVRGFLLESCPRKDPPPGVVVLHPGSRLVLSCSGRVMVDGVRVPVTRERPPAPTAHRSDENNEKAEQQQQQWRRHTNGHTAPPTDQDDWTSGDADDDEDHEDQEEEKGEEDLRETRAVTPARSRAQWRRNGRPVTGGDVLALAAVTGTDSGTYTCHRHRRQGDSFSVKIHVAGPPEQPILECYKRSPSSKIRCGWTPQGPVSAHTSCSLLLYKGLEGNMSRTECSYSSRHSWWWCAVGHTEDEHRTQYTAALCASSLTGSSVSDVLEFTPMSILKPDPPSEVNVSEVEGQERRLVVTWRPPLSWKSQDNFYALKYELMYRPLQSTLDTVIEIEGEAMHLQVKKRGCHTITDALPGMEYIVRLRAKDEYEGHWSDWSAAFYGRTWTAQTSTMSSTDDLSITMYPFYPEYEGSGIQEAVFNGGEQSHSAEVVWYPILLAASSCVILLVAGYTVRRLGLALPCSIHKPPSSSSTCSTTSPQQAALSPSRYKHTLPDEEEQQERGGGGGEEEEDDNGEEVTEETKALHFDNSSYFLVGQ